MISPPDLRRLLVLVLFGLVFGYVEAAAVVYIRASYAPVHQRLFPDRDADDLFPLITLEQWEQHGPRHTQPLMEVGREIGTILMMALLALGLSRSAGQWFASFVLVFGVWDVSYYASLWVLMGWPRSLLDWDLVFAVPLPWVSPVLAPLVVAAVMIATGLVFFWREAAGRPLTPRAWHWAAVLGGGLLIVVAFCWDYRSMLANGSPVAFNWPLFLLGLAVGSAGFVHCLWADAARV